MRYLIGIDVSKFKHTASVIDNDGVVYVEPFDFNNDIIGFQLFLSTVSSFTNDDYIIGMEDTGIRDKGDDGLLLKQTPQS